MNKFQPQKLLVANGFLPTIGVFGTDDLVFQELKTVFLAGLLDLVANIDNADHGMIICPFADESAKPPPPHDNLCVGKVVKHLVERSP